MRYPISSIILCFSAVLANPWDRSAESSIDQRAGIQRNGVISLSTSVSPLENADFLSKRSSGCVAPSECPSPFVLQPYSNNTSLSGNDSAALELVGQNGAIVSDGCTSAVRFLIREGELYDYNTNFRISTNQGVANAPFPYESNVSGDIDDSFSLDTTLTWTNGNFRSSQARFCLLSSTGRIYAVFTISPPNCSPVQLVPLQCPNNPKSNSTTSTLPACPASTNSARLTSTQPANSTRRYNRSFLGVIFIVFSSMSLFMFYNLFQTSSGVLFYRPKQPRRGSYLP